MGFLGTLSIGYPSMLHNGPPAGYVVCMLRVCMRESWDMYLPASHPDYCLLTVHYCPLLPGDSSAISSKKIHFWVKIRVFFDFFPMLLSKIADLSAIWQH